MIKRAIIYAVAVTLFFISAVMGQDPIFSAEVSAADRREHFVRVNRWGRYRFEASGADGVALQVADKRRGAFAEAKTSGMTPAIVETFLEAGDYKVITRGPEDARGTVKVSAREYVINNDSVEYMVVHKETAVSLDTTGAAAWFIFVPRDTLVYIEAMGRHLGGLAVFRSGEDMLIAEASAKTGGNMAFLNGVDPQRPLNGLRVAHRLQRGKHLVVAYGGGRDRYTVEDEKSPLFIQWMVQPLNRTRQLNAKVRESGVNRYSLSPPHQNWVIESDTTLTLELITVTPSGGVSRTSLNQTNRRSGARYATIPPFSSEQNNLRYLSVIGKPGVEFRLTPIVDSRNGIIKPQKDGDFRIRTMHTGHHEDNIGASGVFIDLSDTTITALQADTLSESSPALRRQFNLLSRDIVSSLLWVEKPGTYIFEPEGTSFSYRVKRFYVKPPRDYKEPELKRGVSSDMSLREGLYVIDISSSTSGGLGRAGFTIAPSEFYATRRPQKPIEPAKPRASLTFNDIKLKRDNTYLIYVNSQSPEATSIVAEELPLEDDISRVVYFIDNDAERQELTTEKLPILEFGKIQYAVYGKKALKMYGFEIREAGIYKLETTGRLHTKITARDRAGAVIASADSNGAGRNSVIAEYFLPGRYALIAETRGESAGQMGVVINKGELVFGGQLEDRADARTSVGAFGAVIYNLTINEDGRYAINSYGQSGMMRARLEDGEGWPVFEHGALMPREVDINRGAYRLFSLPLTYASERVAGIARLGDMSAGKCVESLRDEGLRVGMCYNFISVEPPTENNDEEESYYYHRERRYEPSFTMSDNSISVRVDTAGVYEIYSQGGTDVSARLFAEETLVARNVSDERNWNFVLSERLVAGTYRLEMTTGAKRFPSTRVFMRRVEDTLAQKITLTATGKGPHNVFTGKISPNGKQAVIPIEVSSGDVLTLKATSASRIACVLESRSGNHAIVFDQRQGRVIRVSLPVERGADYTLKIRSLDGWSSCAVDLTIGAFESKPVSFQNALTGITGTVEKNPHFDDEAFFRIDDVKGGPGHYELVAAENGIERVLGTSAAQQFFQKEEGSLIAASGNQLWFKATFKSAGKYNFILNPVRLVGASEHQRAETGGRSRRKFETADQYRHSRPARNRALQVEYPIAAREFIPVIVRENQNRIFELDTSIKNLALLTFTMNAGQPVAGLSTAAPRADFVRNRIPIYGGQYISEKICVTAVIPGDTGRIVAWNALHSDHTDGVNGVLTMTDFVMEEGIDTLKTGRTTWRPQTPAAKEYHLETGRDHLVTAKISPRAGVLYIAPNGKRTMYYGGDGGAVHSIELNGGQMFLFGGSSYDNAANIELETFASKPSVSNVLSGASAFTKHFLTDTREAVRANSRDLGSTLLFWSGSIRNIDFINELGQMTRNVPNHAIRNNFNGTFFVDFASGWSALKFCSVDSGQTELTRCLWGEPLPTSDGATAVKEMSRLTMAAGVNRYNIDLDKPTHVNITAPTPPAAALISIAVDDERFFVYDDYWNELSIDIPLGKGSHIVGLKPIANRSLDGVPLTIRFYPMLTLTEDEPLALYLPPGEKRMARFDLERKSRIGIGLQVSAETVEAILIDNSGKVAVDRGRQIFTELDKGAYYVLLSNPLSSDGVDAKVFLFGQNAPPLDPPQELIKWLTGGGVGERP